MIVLARVLSAAIVIAAIARAGTALLFNACDFPSRVAIYFVEPQMVHLARCAQHGELIYPDWKNFPYVANIYTPAYFWGVGMIGRIAGADLDGVTRIGRATTVLFSLLGAVVVGRLVRSQGRGSVVVASSFSFGSVLMMGFGGMVRPDVTADVLGFVGFLTATAKRSVPIAGAILSVAILCKQSAVIYVAAASIALLWMKHPRRAVMLAAVSALVVFAVLVAIRLIGEQNVFSSVFLETASPWRRDQWQAITVKFLARSSDVLLFCTAGAVHWFDALRRGNARDADDAKRWLSLLAIGGGFAVLGIAKVGSDLNYFLPLRYLASITLAIHLSRFRPTPGNVANSSAFLFALVFWTLPWWYGLSRHEAIDSNRGRMARIYQNEIDAIERSSKTQRIFTNCDDAALRVGGLTLDMYAFKVMVEDGRVQPTALVEKLKKREYDLVVMTGVLDDPTYRDSPFASPPEITQAILEGYEKASQAALVYYRRKK